MSQSINIKKIALNNDLNLVHLFGSKAKNTDSPISDIDIAVLLNNLEKRDINLLNLFISHINGIS